MLRQFLEVHPYLTVSQCCVIVKFAGQLLQELVPGPGDAEKNLILLFFFPLSHWKYNFLTLIWAELPTKALCRALGHAGPEHSAAGSCICQCWL